MRRTLIRALATVILCNLPACDPSDLDGRDLVIVGASDGGDESSGGDTGGTSDTLGLEFPEPEVCEPGLGPGVGQQPAFREPETVGDWRADPDPQQSGVPTPGQIARGALCVAACYSAYAKCGSPTYDLTTYSICLKQCDVLAKLSCNALWARCGTMPTKATKEACFLFYNVVCSGQ